MRDTILSQEDLDAVSRDMAARDRRDRAIFWRWMLVAIILEIAIGAWWLL